MLDYSMRNSYGIDFFRKILRPSISQYNFRLLPRRLGNGTEKLGATTVILFLFFNYIFFKLSDDATMRDDACELATISISSKWRTILGFEFAESDISLISISIFILGVGDTNRFYSCKS